MGFREDCQMMSDSTLLYHLDSCMSELQCRFKKLQFLVEESNVDLNRQRTETIREGDTCPRCKEDKLFDMGNGTSGLRCMRCGFATAGGQGEF